MKEDTGRIDHMTAEEMEAVNKNLKPGKQWLPIPDDELPGVRGMNRKQRRAWAKQQRAGEAYIRSGRLSIST